MGTGSGSFLFFSFGGPSEVGDDEDEEDDDEDEESVPSMVGMLSVASGCRFLRDGLLSSA